MQAGDHVGVLATNCIEWVEAMYGIYKIRARVVNVNFRYVEEEMRYLFDNSDLVALVYQREYGPIVGRVTRSRSSSTSSASSGTAPTPTTRSSNPIEFEAAIASGSPERDFGERSDDDVYLLYTGGTTGMPKGVMWRQEDVYYALGGGIDAMTNERVTRPSEASEKIDASAPQGIVALPVPPLMHGAGQFSIFRVTCEGNTAVLVDKFDAEETWRLVEKHRINMMSVTGDAMARPLADALERMQGDVDISSLLSFGSTAAIFSQTVKEQLRELLPDPNLVMTDAIGSTETGMNGIRVVQDGDAPKEGITTVLASADTTVLDDDLRPLEPGSGKVGRLARGGNIPLGYYHDPEKTAATFITDSQGRRWSIPGDYALLEADGRITLLGRGSVSINSGGEKIYPEEVEGALKSHPDVFDVLVVGVPDQRWGERVAALLQAREGQEPTLEELKEHCRSRIAGYKVPRELLLVAEIPRWPTASPTTAGPRSRRRSSPRRIGRWM